MTYIKVNHRHISKGKIGDCQKCPIALAIGERVKTKNVEVFTFGIWVDDIQCFIPPKVEHFLFNFDTRKSVKPFGFKLVYKIRNHININK